jgi:hypothetical protein
MSCVLQDDLKRFVSEPQSPPQGIEIPEGGKTKTKAMERREVGEGDDTVIVEDTRGIPEVDECGLAEIGNSKEETRGT